MADYPSYSRDKPSHTASKVAGWLYEVDGEEHGPIDFRTLRSHALSKKFLGHHSVWKEGSEEKQAASAIIGLIPPADNHPSKPPQPVVAEKDPYATPPSGTIGEGPPGGLYLPHLSPANVPLYLATLAVPAGLIYLSREIQAPVTVAFVLALAGFGLIGWLALSIIYVHRAWEMMRMLGAHLTGAKAVRFLFIPFFNALWCFVAIYGWSRLWNHNFKNHPGLRPARPVWAWLFFLFPILFLVSQGLLLMHFFIQEWPTNLKDQRHLISLGIWTATLLVTLVTWSQLCRSINFLARKKS